MSNETFFFCSCGESYSGLRYAINCRKCRRYLLDEDYPRRTVTAERAHRAPVTVFRADQPNEANVAAYQQFIERG